MCVCMYVYAYLDLGLKLRVSIICLSWVMPLWDGEGI